MNILGSCRNLLRYLSLSPAAESGEAKKPKDPVADNDNDGPGAGGGYSDSVELASPKKTEAPSDGPADTGDSDGPGAGGGYDSFSDHDGPGAGGGYFSATGSLQNTWTTTANYLGQEWFMGPTSTQPANSNKKPEKGKGE